ncbi:MAG TPA: xanthine dehydrogenase family protein subunit M [Pseudolabrys sp.]|jgi:carbon-monoxide dehydrogenase medium subunit|uniref:FAD binding domain-containing protein n=1 Tax=Pseudolabrys sp. TaxID=1960880 RepID=UPI002DDCC098|nr:xanthine dehydrogenase family protein subunit M [Pseudolabrys sp.]HEV2627027.1 xanthine dehydrogenase family protein subunit M [Pseudolabrys sp.]
MHDFIYHQPQDLNAAARLLGAKAEAKLLAGGMSLLPSLKLRLAQYSDLVALKSIAALQGIRREGDTLTIGAMTRHAVVAASEEVRQAIPALAVLAGGIGDPLVRNRGTIGGSIANADPAADYPSAVLGLGATVITDRREIAGDSFFTGLFETALDDGEIITAVRFPMPLRSGYMKLPHPASRFALTGVFVAQTRAGVRVAITGAGASVFRLTAAEQALSVDFSPATLDGVAADPNGLTSDIHASAEYRAHAIIVLAKRAVAAAQPR